MRYSRRSAGVCLAPINAEVAELADAHGSGPCTRKGVGVRVPSSAPTFIFNSLVTYSFGGVCESTACNISRFNGHLRSSNMPRKKHETEHGCKRMALDLTNLTTTTI